MKTIQHREMNISNQKSIVKIQLKNHQKSKSKRKFQKHIIRRDSHTNKEDTHVYKMLCEFHSLRVGGDVVCTLAHGGQGMEL